MTGRRPTVKIQHLELTMPRGTLTKQMCDDIDGFWCGIFGWTSDDVNYPEYDDLTQHRLLADGQAIILTEADEAMVLPDQRVGVGPGETVAVPHLGVQLESLDELECVLEECRAFQKHDDRVKLWDSGEIRFRGEPSLHHAFLVNFLLPTWFDVFAKRWDEGHEPQRQWRYLDLAEAGR
jgi:hypothetical protein